MYITRHGEHDPEGSQPKKLLGSAKKRRAIRWVRKQLSVSERRACRALEQPRTTQRQEPRMTEEEEMLRERIVDLACSYDRYGYRRITGLLRNQGWHVNHKRVERIWRQEGLNVP
jgi:putative transposase